MPTKSHPRGGRLRGGIKEAVAVSLPVLLFAVALCSAAAPQLGVEALGADLTLLGPANSLLSMTSGSRAMATCDLNGDGIQDLVIGALVGGRPGGALVVYGSSGAAANTVRDLANEPDVTVLAGPDDFGAGFGVACGDVNGDGRKDLVLGAFAAVNRATNSDTGKVVVIYGNSSVPSFIDLATTPPDVTIWGRNRKDNLGISVALGDLNADLVDDIVMGSSEGLGPPGDERFAGGDPLGVGPGVVYVVYGRSDLPSIVDFAVDAPDLVLYGEDGEDSTGISVNVHDLNGDGFADLVLGSASAAGPDNTRQGSFLQANLGGAGEVYIVHGSAALPAVLDVAARVGPAPDVRAYGAIGEASDQFGRVGRFPDHFGLSLAVADVDGNGARDILVGAPMGGALIGRPQAGTVYVIHGGTLPPVLDTMGEVGPPPDNVIRGAQGSLSPGDDSLGTQVAAGDLNGDGIADILAVAERGDAPYQRFAEGAVYVYYGSASLPAVMDVRGELGPAPDVILYSGGGLANTSPGFLKVAAGDVNGDGIDELIAGAPLTFIPPPLGGPEGRPLAGAVFVFNIPRLAALPPPPAATVAHYNANRKRLKITVPGATGNEIVEINGHLVGPWWDIRKPITFDPATSRFTVKGGRGHLFLSKTPGVNTIVIIKDGLRSAPFAF